MAPLRSAYAMLLRVLEQEITKTPPLVFIEPVKQEEDKGGAAMDNDGWKLDDCRETHSKYRDGERLQGSPDSIPSEVGGGRFTP